ncbi:MAG TPA: hypothetical protein ENK14_00790 [Caldithrix sp.]|nr:hypothetical protein [Caldithrix sp.]
MRFSRLIFILWCLGFVPVPIRAQEPDSTLLTLDRIYQSDEFTEETFGPARWQKNGSGYFTLEWSDVEPGRKDIVRYNAESGARKIVVPTTWLTPANDSISLPIDNYRWSPKEECLLIFTNSKKVWRRKTRGDYWVLNLKNRRLHQLGGTAKPATLMFASFSPDGERVAYVREHNLYVEDLKSGKITQLTFDGSRTIINGTFDWVY